MKHLEIGGGGGGGTIVEAPAPIDDRGDLADTTRSALRACGMQIG